jgi:hypothetical protein
VLYKNIHPSINISANKCYRKSIILRVHHKKIWGLFISLCILNLHIALKSNDFNFPMNQTDIKINHFRQILISLFHLELSMERVETRTKRILKILAKHQMDTTNEVIGVGSKLFHSPLFMLQHVITRIFNFYSIYSSMHSLEILHSLWHWTKHICAFLTGTAM